MCQEMGFASLRARSLQLLGIARVDLGHLKAARAALAEGLPASIGLGDRFVIPIGLTGFAAGVPAGPAEVTVVFDAGQNSEANFAHLAAGGLGYVGSVPASDCPDLLALPASDRTVVDEQRFGGLTAYDTRRIVYGAERRAGLTPSPELDESQGRRVRRHHAGQGREEARRAGRHPGPRQDPPGEGEGPGRDRADHPRAVGPPRHHLGTDRRPAPGPAPGLGH